MLCSARFIFVSTFNLQRGRAFVVGITNLSKQAVCVKAKAPADHVYQRRTWDEFKRVLSVAHASQTVERAENLEYRNQLAGVCRGALHCSSHIIFVTCSNFEMQTYEIESIFFNHAVFPSQAWISYRIQLHTKEYIFLIKADLQVVLKLQCFLHCILHESRKEIQVHFDLCYSVWRTEAAFSVECRYYCKLQVI